MKFLLVQQVLAINFILFCFVIIFCFSSLRATNENFTYLYFTLDEKNTQQLSIPNAMCFIHLPFSRFTFMRAIHIYQNREREKKKRSSKLVVTYFSVTHLHTHGKCSCTVIIVHHSHNSSIHSIAIKTVTVMDRWIFGLACPMPKQ